VIDLSIIIVNRNTKEYLLPCLRSVLENGKGTGWKIIVVDNGSWDGSPAEVKKEFSSIDLIENEGNLGFAKAVNQGLQKAPGRYVVLLNPDTQVKKGAIGELISFMDDHHDAGIAGAKLLNSDGSKQNSIANFPSLATELSNKSLLRWLFPNRFPGKERDYSEPVEVDSVIGACMMVRRDAIEQVGLLDEDYFLFLEETDWCFRMKKAAWRVCHVPQAEVYHFQGKSAEKDKRRAKIEYYRSRYHFFKKHRGYAHFCILLFGLVIKLIVEWIFAGMVCIFSLFTIRRWRKRLFICTHAIWWHLRLCPEGMGLKPNDGG
jgi:GT2 family glycosyltransferase